MLESPSESRTCDIDVKGLVARVVADYLGHETPVCDPSAPLADQGLDSFDVMEMILDIQDEIERRIGFTVQIPDGDVHSYLSIDDLSRITSEALSKKSISLK